MRTAARLTATADRGDGRGRCSVSGQREMAACDPRNGEMPPQAVSSGGSRTAISQGSVTSSVSRRIVGAAVRVVSSITERSTDWMPSGIARPIRLALPANER